MSQPLLRKGDVIAIRAVVQVDQVLDHPIYARLGGWRDVATEPAEVHEVLERYYEVGDRVRVFAAHWSDPIGATVRAVVKDRIVVEDDRGEIGLVLRKYVELIPAPPHLHADPLPTPEAPPSVAADEPAPAPAPEAVAAEEVLL